MDWTDPILRYRQVAGAYEGGNEASGSIKCRYFLTGKWLVSQEGLCSTELVNILFGQLDM